MVKKIIALMLVSIICGCTPQCTGDSKQHNFGKWELESFSYIQVRHCTVCGWAEGERIGR